GDADLCRARKAAEQMVVTAKAESEQRILAGRGESTRVMQVGLSEASVLMKKIASFGDPRLYALSLVAEHLSKSTQPLVPERVFMTGSNGEPASAAGTTGLIGQLLNLLVAEKSGFATSDNNGASTELKDFADRMTKQAMASIEEAPETRKLARN